MSKAHKLKELDEKVLSKMLDWIDSDETERLPELSVAVQYLRANNRTEDKKRENSEQDEMKRKIEEAKKKRENESTKLRNKSRRDD